MKPVNSTDYRRSSRSGSLVHTPDHQAKPSNVRAETMFYLGGERESSNYLDPIANESSTTNSSNSFDAPPDALPPIPPRILNPPRNSRIANDHLIIIDTDDVTDTVPVPVPVARMKTKSMTPSTVVQNRFSFENDFVANPLNSQMNRVANRPFIEPPRKLQNNKLNTTNESKSSEVCRRSSQFSVSLFIGNIHAFKAHKVFVLAFCVSM